MFWAKVWCDVETEAPNMSPWIRSVGRSEFAGFVGRHIRGVVRGLPDRAPRGSATIILCLDRFHCDRSASVANWYPVQSQPRHPRGGSGEKYGLRLPGLSSVSQKTGRLNSRESPDESDISEPNLQTGPPNNCRRRTLVAGVPNGVYAAPSTAFPWANAAD